MGNSFILKWLYIYIYILISWYSSIYIYISKIQIESKQEYLIMTFLRRWLFTINIMTKLLIFLYLSYEHNSLKYYGMHLLIKFRQNNTFTIHWTIRMIFLDIKSEHINFNNKIINMAFPSENVLSIKPILKW